MIFLLQLSETCGIVIETYGFLYHTPKGSQLNVNKFSTVNASTLKTYKYLKTDCYNKTKTTAC